MARDCQRSPPGSASLPKESHQVPHLDVGHGLEDRIRHERVGQDVNVRHIRLLKVKPTRIGVKGVSFCRFGRNHTENYSFISEFKLVVAILFVDLDSNTLERIATESTSLDDSS